MIDVGSAPESVFVGTSLAVRLIRETVAKLAPTTATVLIVGESGTGKEVVARLIHAFSPRAGQPFVVVNCPALPPNLQEAELFGVEKRVATEVDSRPGLLERAEGGTVLLDEIGDLEQSAQAKILRFVQDKTVERVGGRKVLALDIRLLAATNHDLHRLMAEKAFRLDLYHRLNTFTIEIPPLRKRPEDIAPLLAHFLARSSAPELEVSDAALAALERYAFPGNVRELERIVERASIMAEGLVIGPEDLPTLERAAAEPPSGGGGATSGSLADELYDLVVRCRLSFWKIVHRPYLDRTLQAGAVRGLISRAHAEAGGSYRRMARLFGIEDFKEYKKLTAFLRNHGLLDGQGRRTSRGDEENA